MLAHAGAIAAATDLPVSADLESGFGDSPRTVAETIRLAGRRGWPAARSRIPRSAGGIPSPSIGR
jgi:2-methylisocitrate lyase-like PEP mutase family enzyme